MRTVIGLCGFAGSGKDEAARALIEQRGFVKVSFAEPLREAMAALNPIVGTRHVGYDDASFGPAFVRYNAAIEFYGYDVAKLKFPEVRELLQRFGTEVGRRQFGEDFWIEQAKKRIDSLPQYTPVVITDVRFPNEVRVVRDYMGVVVKISRSGVEAVNGHVSDTNVSDLKHDVELLNSGTIEDLHRMIAQVADNNAVWTRSSWSEPVISNEAVRSLLEEDDSWAV